ncbi:hypothetical protein [Paenibacillus sp. An7]|uniref:hypothetical protein n=1 Tax=Paenibacillus sp. An7 TaxID=2689577 RepID=UPI001358473E|nr:hypothetical protein [Paenibacillus sp. An7]
MILKKKNGVYLVGAVIILVIVLVYFMSRPAGLYGNDQESIEKILQSEQVYQNTEIEILEVKDIYDKRVVAFLNDDDPAYAEFRKDEKGNYLLSKFQDRKGEALSSFLIQEFEDQDEVHAASMMYISNQDNTISKLELTVNEDQVFEREFKVHQKAVEWIELPKSNEYHFKYKYDDENDKIID